MIQGQKCSALQWILLSVGAGSCVQSAVVRGVTLADMLESLGFITVVLPERRRESSALPTHSHRAAVEWRARLKTSFCRRGSYSCVCDEQQEISILTLEV